MPILEKRKNYSFPLSQDINSFFHMALPITDTQISGFE